jgi:cellulose synthase/poly-beta-1,6-N-acetylglucosamine synthase-like glycosyltransferase
MNFVPACTAVWRRQVTDRVGPFAESLSSIDDRDLWIRAALTGAHFAYVEEPLAIKDTGPGRLSADKRRHDELAVMMWEQLAAANPTDRRVVEQLQRARWHLSSSYARDGAGGSLAVRASSFWRAARLDHSPRNLARIARLSLRG